MTDSTRNFTVGVTTLAGVVGLGVLLFLFGYIPAFLRSGYPVTIDMADAVTLGEGSPVQLYGIRVGEVRAIQFKDPPGAGVLVTANITRDVRIPMPLHAEVDTDLLGGTATVQLVPDNGPTADYSEYLATDGSAVIEGRLGSLAGAFAQLNRLTTSFEDFSEEWNRVGRNVNALLGDAERGLEVELGGEGFGKILKGFEDRLDQMQVILADVRGYTGDEQISRDLRTTIANARKTSEQADALMTETRKAVADTRTELSDAAGSAEEQLDAVANRVLAVAEDTTATLKQMQSILKVAMEGDGTAGRILNDPALFENFADAALRIGAMADEAKLLVEKWKAEGLPVQF
jgi:phospholipid/cholesterol/gamma-HCH transport system substrate-binding protein